MLIFNQFLQLHCLIVKNIVFINLSFADIVLKSVPTNSPLSMQSGRQSRISRSFPWHMPEPCSRHIRFRCCWWSPSQGVQRDHVSQPASDSQLGISQVSLIDLGPLQLSGPRHSLVLVRTPMPQLAEHSDQSVQHDHWPSAVLLLGFTRHGCGLQTLLCLVRPFSHGGDSHCLTCKNVKLAFSFVLHINRQIINKFK